MRRVLAIVLAVLLVGSLSGTSGAEGSIKVRTDPNDIAGQPDIRNVSTDLTSSHLYVRIDTYGRLRRRDNPQFWIDLNTTGDRRVDQSIEIIYVYGFGWACIVHPPPELFRAASHPNGRTLSCTLPRRWFPDIHRAVRFTVFSSLGGVRVSDRAPNEGRYIWL